MNSNISYKLKYYKYKEKYLNYKQNGGTPKVFYLYTTGITDGGDLFLAKRWNKIFRNSILRNIDSSFNHIIIKHYDPIILTSPQEQLKIINKINEIVIINDNCLSTDKRKITSEFILGPINFHDINNPHLIFDMAHLLNYLPRKRRQLNNHYGDGSNEVFNNINSVYIGWYSERENIHFDYLASSDFVKVFDDGYVLTYIDRMIKFRFMDVSRPLDIQGPGHDFFGLIYEVMRIGGISDDNIAIVANIIMNIIMTTTFKSLDINYLVREVKRNLSS